MENVFSLNDVRERNWHVGRNQESQKQERTDLKIELSKCFLEGFYFEKFSFRAPSQLCGCLHFSVAANQALVHALQSLIQRRISELPCIPRNDGLMNGREKHFFSQYKVFAQRQAVNDSSHKWEFLMKYAPQIRARPFLKTGWSQVSTSQLRRKYTSSLPVSNLDFQLPLRLGKQELTMQLVNKTQQKCNQTAPGRTYPNTKNKKVSPWSYRRVIWLMWIAIFSRNHFKTIEQHFINTWSWESNEPQWTR